MILFFTGHSQLHYIIEAFKHSFFHSPWPGYDVHDVATPHPFLVIFYGVNVYGEYFRLKDGEDLFQRHWESAVRTNDLDTHLFLLEPSVYNASDPLSNCGAPKPYS